MPIFISFSRDRHGVQDYLADSRILRTNRINPVTETKPTSLPYQVKLVDFEIAANKTRLYASRIFNFCSVDGINGNPGILSVINRDTAACKVLGVEYFQHLKKPELTNAKIKILIEEKTDKRKDPSIVPVTETAVVKVIEETALFELKALLIGNTIYKRWLQ